MGLAAAYCRFHGEGEAVTATLVWESPRLKAKFTNPVLHDGFVYGLDDGVLVCLDPATGERRWRSGRYGHGQTLLVGNRLLVTTEDGDVVLVEASPDAHRELARFTAFSQKQWNPPALPVAICWFAPTRRPPATSSTEGSDRGQTGVRPGSDGVRRVRPGSNHV